MGILVNKVNMPKSSTPFKVFIWEDGRAEVHIPDSGVLMVDANQFPEADKHDNAGVWLDVDWETQERAIGTCSHCKARGNLRTRKTVWGTWCINNPFCPQCGAKMVVF